MADIVEINIGALKRDIGEMKDELSAVRSEIKRAYDEVRALDAMWNGPANDEFNKIFQSDYKQMQDMLQTLDDLVDYMERARDEYLHCEAVVSQTIDEIRI